VVADRDINIQTLKRSQSHLLMKNDIANKRIGKPEFNLEYNLQSNLKNDDVG
jgi:hypothetical protein